MGSGPRKPGYANILIIEAILLPVVNGSIRPVFDRIRGK